jgi:hypothetical protein
LATVVQSGQKRTPAKGYTFTQLETLYLNNGGSRKNAPIMAAIALAENHGIKDDYSKSIADPNATNHNSNGTVDQGLWQINSVHAALYKGQNIYDPNVNARIAVQLAEHGSGGLNNWVNYKNHNYKRYLPGFDHTGGISGAIGDAIIGPGRDAVNGVANAPGEVAGAVGGALAKPLEGIAKDIAFGLIIAGGGALILLGLLMIGLDLGLSAFQSVGNTRPIRAYGSFKASKSRARSNQASETRRTELHGQRVRLGEERIKTEKAKATNLRSMSRARSTKARLTKEERAKIEREAYMRGAGDATAPNLAAARRARGRKKVA